MGCGRASRDNDRAGSLHSLETLRAQGAISLAAQSMIGIWRVGVPRLAPRVMRLVQYAKSDLKRLLSEECFWQQPRLPITRRRALSQVANPRADDSDVVLFTASAQGQLIAYIGVLPDLLMNGHQQPMKFGWTTTWWVDKESKHRPAAVAVLYAALQKYSNRLGGSCPSREAERVLGATRKYRECVRFDQTLFVMAPPPTYRSLSLLTGWFAGAKNQILFQHDLQRHQLEIRVLDAVDADFESFVNARIHGDPLLRDSAYWTWVLAFPWVSAAAEDEAEQERYAFSVFAKDFRQVPILVKRRGTSLALLILTLRKGRLTLKYAYYDLSDAADVATALRVAVAGINPYLFVSADCVLNAELKRQFPFYFARIHKTSAIYAANGLPLSLGRHAHWATGEKVFT